MRFVRHSASALAFLCLYTMPLTAQNIGTVRGQVVDSSTRQALAGVTVQIQGTARSTLTGPAGNYSLGDVPAGSVVVRATRIGFAPRQVVVTVSAGGIFNDTSNTEIYTLSLHDALLREARSS